MESQPTGLVGWITTYGSIVGFFVQLLFYVIVAASAAWAAATFSRYVKFMTTDDEAFEDATVETSDTPIDEFVE